MNNITTDSLHLLTWNSDMLSTQMITAEEGELFEGIRKVVEKEVVNEECE